MLFFCSKRHSAKPVVFVSFLSEGSLSRVFSHNRYPFCFFFFCNSRLFLGSYIFLSLISFCLNYQDALVTRRPPPHESCLSSGAAMGSKYISFKLEKICSHSYSEAVKDFCIEMCLEHSHMTTPICLCFREAAVEITLDSWVTCAACVAHVWKWLDIIKITASQHCTDGCIVSFVKYVIKFSIWKMEKDCTAL